MHFAANYVSIICVWAIVNHRTVGTRVTKQKDKDLAIVHTRHVVSHDTAPVVPGTGTIPRTSKELP